MGGAPLCGAGECGDGRNNPPPILFLFLTKRERAAPGPREKTLRRVGPRRARTSMPPARDGWPFLVAAFMKRVALGVTIGPGWTRIPGPPFSAGADLAVCRATSTTRQSASEFRRTDLSTTTPRSLPDQQSRREPVGESPVTVGTNSENSRLKPTCATAQVGH